MDRDCENRGDNESKYQKKRGCKTHAIAWLSEEVKEEPPEKTEMDRSTTRLAEFMCDELCVHAMSGLSEDALEEKCCDCKMGKFVCDILNEYNRINDFDNSQSKKLLVKLVEKERKKCKPQVLNVDGKSVDYYCMNCHTEFVEEEPCSNYCPECGCELDWSEEE